jgi:hypothetical protein
LSTPEGAGAILAAGPFPGIHAVPTNSGADLDLDLAHGDGRFARLTGQGRSVRAR